MNFMWGKKMEVSSYDLDVLFNRVGRLEEEFKSLKEFKKPSKTHSQKEIPPSFVTAHEFYNRYKFCNPGTINTWINQNAEFFEGFCARSRDTYVCPYRVIMYVLSKPKKNPCLNALKEWYNYIPELRSLVDHVQLTEQGLVHKI